MTFEQEGVTKEHQLEHLLNVIKQTICSISSKRRGETYRLSQENFSSSFFPYSKKWRIEHISMRMNSFEELLSIMRRIIRQRSIRNRISSVLHISYEHNSRGWVKNNCHTSICLDIDHKSPIRTRINSILPTFIQ